MDGDSDLKCVCLRICDETRFRETQRQREQMERELDMKKRLKSVLRFGGF